MRMVPLQFGAGAIVHFLCGLALMVIKRTLWSGLFVESPPKAITVSLVTVYKTLDSLEALGLVEEVSPVGDVKRYDGNDERHHHLVCTRCKRVIDFYNEGFDELGVELAAVGGDQKLLYRFLGRHR